MNTATREISNSDDIIDSREVIARIDELKAEWTETTEGDDPDDYALSEEDWSVGLGDDGAAEIVALLALTEEGQSSPDWQYGETLIRDTYFVEYAQQLAEDIGAVDPNAGWPNGYIDWDRAAEALQMDYTLIDFDGVTYWIHA